jgi:hypothetical protein
VVAIAVAGAPTKLWLLWQEEQQS